MLNAAWKFRLYCAGATTYCRIFWLPLGLTARAVTSYTCFCVDVGAGTEPTTGGTTIAAGTRAES